jgi:uncharacterized protein involved in exopolysaccharide biosynthesis/Mrp family chromosome partitioning ATPase
VVSLVSYQLALHDLEQKTPFRQMKKEDLEMEWNDEIKKEYIKILKQRIEEFKPLNTFEEEDNKLLSLLWSYRYDFGSLIDNITIDRQGSSDFIAVEFVSENPILSAFTVNTLCQEFIKFNRNTKADKSSESLDLLQSILVDKKKVLEERTRALDFFKQQNQVFDLSAETQQKIEQLTEYELNLETEQKKINGLSLSISTLDAKIKPLQEKGKDEVIAVNQRIIDLRKRINDASASNASQATINQLRDELQLEMSRLATLNSAVDQEELKQLIKERDTYSLEQKIAYSNLEAINSSLRKLKSEVSGFTGKETQLANLQLQVQLASDEYLEAQQKMNDAENKALVGGSNIKQVLQGQPSKDPEPSKSILLVGLAGFGSLSLVIISLLGLEFMDFSIRTQDKFESLTGLKTMGSVNEIDNQNLNLQKAFMLKNKSPEIDRFVHSLRKIRFDIQNAGAKHFLVTSTQDGAGKSFVTVCISYALSLTNKKVLIIDTNFKNNSLTKMLIPKSDRKKLLPMGLMEKPTLLLNGGKEKSDLNGENFTMPNTDESANKSIVQATIYQNVDIIGNQGGTESPFEILAGKDFAEMMRILGDQYDYIFLEGAALNEYSDSKELIEFVDKIIPVFSADTTINTMDKESIKYLKSIDEKLMGTVLNNVKLKDLKI